MRLTILAAFLVGLVYSFYHWAIPNLWQVKPYSPLTLNKLSPSFAVDETFFYAPKIAQLLADPGELVGSGLMALLAKISGGIDKAFMLADFIFPALTFMILAYLLNLWLKNRLLSLTAALLVLTFYHYLTYFPYLPSVIKLMVQGWREGGYSSLIRSFHPQISLGLFFLFAARPNWLTLTLLTYTHFFYWTIAFVWLIIYRFGRKLIKTIIPWLILTLPYWLFIIQRLPAKDYWARNYYFVPITLNQALLLAFGFLLALKNKYWLSFYIAVTLAIAAASVTKFGADDPIGHWFLRVVNPMTAILIVVSLFNKLKLKPGLLMIIFFLVLGFQFRLHWQYFKNNAAAFSIEPERLEAFNYLKQNTPKDSVVAAGMKESLYLPAYTQNISYLKQAQLSQANNQELLQRFLDVNKLAGVSKEQLILMFSNQQELKAKKRFDFDNCAGNFLFFRLYKGSDYYDCSIPEDKLKQILTQYDSISPQLSYPADYWLGTDDIDFGSLLWENRDYKIYKLL